MVDQVKKNRSPEQFADGTFRTGEVADCAVEIRRREVADAFHGLGVDSLVAGRESVNGTRPLDTGRPKAELKGSLLDAVCGEGFKFGKMPGQLSQRPALRIGPEIVLILW